MTSVRSERVDSFSASNTAAAKQKPESFEQGFLDFFHARGKFAFDFTSSNDGGSDDEGAVFYNDDTPLSAPFFPTTADDAAGIAKATRRLGDASLAKACAELDLVYCIRGAISRQLDRGVASIAELLDIIRKLLEIYLPLEQHTAADFRMVCATNEDCNSQQQSSRCHILLTLPKSVQPHVVYDCLVFEPRIFIFPPAQSSSKMWKLAIESLKKEEVVSMK